MVVTSSTVVVASPSRPLGKPVIGSTASSLATGESEHGSVAAPVLGGAGDTVTVSTCSLAIVRLFNPISE